MSKAKKVSKRPPARRDSRSAASRAPTAWRVSPEVVSQRLDDEVILVDLRSDRVYALNGTAARVWELVVSGRSIAGIERKLVREFAVSPARLRQSVTRLLSMLERRKLVRATRR
jgi:Coenzyme PQQ synthesis protein D (PqqD)